jgi:hypothetical protein
MTKFTHRLAKLAAPMSAALLAAGAVTLAPSASATPPQVTFEAFGSGTATTIDLDPAPGGQRIYDAPLPFSRTMALPSGTTLLQVVVVGSTDVNPGCRIKVNGKVLAEKPVGGDAHCIADITGMSFGDDAKPDTQSQGITYRVKGSGTALTINIEPGGIRLENVPLPFSKTVPSAPGQLLELSVVPGPDLQANPGCSITVDGVVRADKPAGADGLCVVDQ